MDILLCVDDTDDLTKATSTGAIAQEIGEKFEAMGGVLQEGISRHQLLLDEAIKYTSHNSAMCLVVKFENPDKAKLICCAEQVILSRRAEVSDPGLAICFPDLLQNPQALLDFGFRAKQKVMTKAAAYALAEADAGLFLEELGGDGSGVIGALAGLALRFSRCDGTLRGKIGQELAGEVMVADLLCKKLGIAAIFDEQGVALPLAAKVVIETRAKITFWDGKLIVWSKKRGDGVFAICSTHQEVEAKNFSQGNACKDFQWDNDVEELSGVAFTCCLNCLYRRWLSAGYRCMLADEKASQD